jgi:hypothetical protein
MAFPWALAHDLVSADRWDPSISHRDHPQPIPSGPAEHEILLGIANVMQEDPNSVIAGKTAKTHAGIAVCCEMSRCSRESGSHTENETALIHSERHAQETSLSMCVFRTERIFALITGFYLIRTILYRLQSPKASLTN